MLSQVESASLVILDTAEAGRIGTPPSLASSNLSPWQPLIAEGENYVNRRFYFYGLAVQYVGFVLPLRDCP